MKTAVKLLPVRIVLWLSVSLFASGAGAANFVVRMQGTRFVPRDITITVGDSITWTNLDFAGHDSVSGTNGVASGFWRTPLFGFGGSATVVFTNITPRSYGYYCTPHVFVGMVGSVTVLPGNTPPTVRIIEPADGAVVRAGVPLTITADPEDADGRIARVEFTVDGLPLPTANTPPYVTTYANPTAGEHIIRAVAVDTAGAASTPAEVKVTVPGPAPPRVTLTSPGGTVFPQASLIALVAVLEPDAPVTNVEFIANGLVLAEVSPSSEGTSAQFDWLPGDFGNFELSAIATDDLGLRGTSAPIAVLVYDAADATRPTLSLAGAPRNFARVQTNELWLSGTAADDRGLARVEVSQSGQFVSAEDEWHSIATFPPGTRTASWQTAVQIYPGQNTIRLRALDLATNLSFVETRYYTFVSNALLRVSNNGAGRVSPDWDGRRLEIGKTYRLRALPQRGNVFVGWKGAPAQGATLDFVMKPDLKLTAHFVTNPFVLAAGQYSGLMQDTNTFAPDGNGLITLQVSDTGAFSGRLLAAGRRHSFRGCFGTNGAADAVALRPGMTPVVLSMNVDLTGTSGELMGSAMAGDWEASLLALRNPFATGTNLSPHVGPRYFYWADASTSARMVPTELRISSRGKVSLKATLEGGRIARAVSADSQFGWLPVVFSSAQSDSLVGWARVMAQGDPRVFGVGWLIPPSTNQVATELNIEPVGP